MTATLSPRLRKTVQIATTGALVIAAVLGARSLWAHYQADPWTRDGRVRADIVAVAPDVTGLVTAVRVANDQHVRRGDPLFEIDRARYDLALREAESAVAKAHAGIARVGAVLAEARREAARNRGLGDLVATEATQQSEAKVADGEAMLAEAKTAEAAAVTARDLARLNLARTIVRAPTDGVISDQTLRPGNYLTAGKPVMALIDTASLRIEGYFEETKLSHVHIGQAATVRLMGEAQPITGHVTSIAAAIEDHDRTGSANLLPAINPSFSWVRLAQRVPVRIAIDHPRADMALIAGRTATVTLTQDKVR